MEEVVEVLNSSGDSVVMIWKGFRGMGIHEEVGDVVKVIPNSVSGGELWDWILGEELDSVGGSDFPGLGHIDFVVSIVMECWFTVKALVSMSLPCSSLLGSGMDDAFATWWCKRGFVEIKVSFHFEIG